MGIFCFFPPGQVDTPGFCSTCTQASGNSSVSRFPPLARVCEVDVKAFFSLAFTFWKESCILLKHEFRMWYCLAPNSKQTTYPARELIIEFALLLFVIAQQSERIESCFKPGCFHSQLKGWSVFTATAVHSDQPPLCLLTLLLSLKCLTYPASTHPFITCCLQSRSRVRAQRYESNSNPSFYFLKLLLSVSYAREIKTVSLLGWIQTPLVKPWWMWTFIFNVNVAIKKKRQLFF